jgi:hypothetical protein
MTPDSGASAKGVRCGSLAGQGRMTAMLDHINAAEHALRWRAEETEGEEERARFAWHAEVLAQVQRDFEERPLSEGAIAQRELVDALLDGTDALRLQADAERQAACVSPEPAHREARAAELEGKADAILELDRELS